MKDIRYGIIGLGNQGSFYTKMFKNGDIKNGVITALCDNNPNKIEIIKGRYDLEGIKFFSDYIEMLDSGLCDVILVETPHYDHPKMVLDCLERGLNVICDKPAGVYAKQVKEMNAEAEKHDAVFGMMFNQRTNCTYKKMREMIKNGDIGELQRITWTITTWVRTQQYYNSGGWRATWSGEGGGVLINQCPHQLDLLQWIVGELPMAVRGFCNYGKYHEVEIEDEVTAYLEYKNGATGVFISTTGEWPGANHLEISGTRGKLVCEGGTKLTFYKNEVDTRDFIKDASIIGDKGVPDFEVIEVDTGDDRPEHAGILNNFTQHLLGNEPLFVEGKEGIHMVQLMNAIEYSGWMGGERVVLPVDEDKYLAALNEKVKNSKKFGEVVEIVSATTMKA
ncbi:MAG: Gfo/Idh/MocA family oxidoreductase [Clostridia bacterium]|nr:Gfo/Idh/MocA family oxidoreductase [Clostridia bacterium]